MSKFFLEGRVFDTQWRRGPVKSVPDEVALLLEGIDRCLEEVDAERA